MGTGSWFLSRGPAEEEEMSNSTASTKYSPSKLSQAKERIASLLPQWVRLGLVGELQHPRELKCRALKSRGNRTSMTDAAYRLRGAGPSLPAKTRPAALLLSPHPAFVENAAGASHPQWPTEERTRQSRQQVESRLLMRFPSDRGVQRRVTLAAKSFFALLYSSTALCSRDSRRSILCKDTHVEWLL